MLTDVLDDCQAEVRRLEAEIARLTQERDAQFAHNTALVERVKELEEDNEFVTQRYVVLQGIIDPKAREGTIRWDHNERCAKEIVDRLHAVEAARAEAHEDGARLSDALDVTHARFLAADAQLVREGAQAAGLIARVAAATYGPGKE